jgi:hypothetical protein
MRPLQHADLQKSVNLPANSQFLLFALPEIQRRLSIANHGFGWIQEEILQTLNSKRFM